MKISELNAGQPIIDSSGRMVQHFRNVMLRLVRSQNDGGAVNRATISVTADYTVTDLDYLIIVSSGSPTITLRSSLQGREYVIKNSGAGTVTIEGEGAEEMDGNLTLTASSLESYTLVGDNGNWVIV